jgi:hypothetical protein
VIKQKRRIKINPKKDAETVSSSKCCENIKKEKTSVVKVRFDLDK